MLRRIAPTLGLVALLVPAASAQDIAKGVTLQAYVDTNAIAQTNTSGITGVGNELPVKDGGTYSQFHVQGDIKLGWKPSDEVSGLLDIRALPSNVSNQNVQVLQAYLTAAPNDKLSISGGTSYGPMGYYAPDPTGGFAVTVPLTCVNGYGNNPTGVWATLTPNGMFNATVLVANNIIGAPPANASATGYNGNTSNRNGIGAAALDLVFNPVDEISLNLEGSYDLTGGGVEPLPSTTSLGSAYWIGFNGQYKKDALTAAFEVWHKDWTKSLNNGLATTDYDDLKQNAFMLLANYALPSAPVPTSLTAMVSGLYTGQEINTNDLEQDKQLKLTLAALTNPLKTDSFGLNFEVSYLQDKPADSTADTESSMIFAVEGLIQLK